MRRTKPMRETGGTFHIAYDEGMQYGLFRILLGFLNDDYPGTCDDPETQSRVRDLVSLAKRTATTLATLDSLSDSVEHKQERFERCRSELGKLNQAFSGIRLCTHVSLSEDGRALSIGETLHEELPASKASKDAYYANFAALAILSLIRTDDLERLRRCKECAKWFVAAGRSDAGCCTVACRKRHHAKKPEVKQQRKENYNSPQAKRERERRKKENARAKG